MPWCSFWPSPGEEMRWCNSSHTGASHKHESFYLHSLCFFSLTFERITWLTMCGAPVSHCCTHIYYIYINMDGGSELKRKTTTALTISPVGVLSVKTPSTPSLWRAASSKYGSFKQMWNMIPVEQVGWNIGFKNISPSFRNITPNQMAELPPGFTLGETKKLCFSLLTPEARNIFRKTGRCIETWFVKKSIFQ